MRKFSFLLSLTLIPVFAHAADEQGQLSYEILIFILVFLVVGLLFALWFINSRLNSMRESARMEKEINKFKTLAFSQQLNPHFIFNTLTSIQYYVAENDSEKSEEYLTKFSRLMRIILDNSDREKTSLQDEVKTLELYLELESLRFKHPFKYNIQAKPGLLEDTIPPFLVQPFVENAIWHGLQEKTDGEIIIQFIDEGETILCKITDNGIGREKAEELKKKRKPSHKSKGVEIIQKRLEVFNDMYGTDLKIKYKDLKNESGKASGTEITINIPKI